MFSASLMKGGESMDDFDRLCKEIRIEKKSRKESLEKWTKASKALDIISKGLGIGSKFLRSDKCREIVKASITEE
jgi:hypothetical protein